MCFLCNGVVYSQDYDILFPEERELPPSEGEVELPKPPAEIKAEEEKILIPSLNGIVLITNPKLVKKWGMPHIKGIVSLGPRADLLKNKKLITSLNKFIDQPASFNSLQRIAREIVIFYRKHDRPVVDVLIPEQEVKGGVVQVLVLEGVLGEVRAEGNKYFKSEYLITLLGMKPDDRFSQRYLEYSLDWINYNPFRRVDLIFTPGREIGKTDVILNTTDRSPVRLFGGYDNTGTFITDTIRWSAGFNWGDALWLDQQLNAQVITSPNFKNLLGYAGSWVIPISLPWRQVVTVLGSYATSEAIENLTPFHIEGIGWQLSGRYDVPIIAPTFLEQYKHNVQFGFDFKQTNNTLSFGNTTVTDSTVDIDQFLWSYAFNLKDNLGATSGDIKLVYSPGDLSSHNTNSEFQTLRAFATSKYFYGLLQAQRLLKLPLDFSIFSKFWYQFTRENLIPSEEFGLGGHDTVRGYQERAENGDSGYLGSVELYSPPFSPLSKVKLLGRFKIKDELKFLFFWDYGVAVDNILLPQQPKTFTLSSIGPGLRYSIPPNFTLRFDYGFPFYDVGDFFTWSHGHIGIVASW